MTNKLKQKIFIIIVIIILSLLAIGTISIFGILNLTDKKVEAKSNTFTPSITVSSAKEASEIAGYEVLVPSFIPEILTSYDISVTELKIQNPNYNNNVVLQLWSCADMYSFIYLTQQEIPCHLSNSQIISVKGRMVEKIYIEEKDNYPAKITLRWEQNGIIFILTGTVNANINEYMLNNVAGSIIN
jgi:hypothetical protein